MKQQAERETVKRLLAAQHASERETTADKTLALTRSAAPEGLQRRWWDLWEGLPREMLEKVKPVFARAGF